MIEPVIVFVSTRDNPAAEPMINAAELYVIHLDGSHARRLTDNSVADAFPALAPGARRLVFDSNRLRTDEEPVNTSDLFVMDWDGEHLHYLTRGSSASWSPDDRRIAYHASASGTGLPIRTDPGSATSDSDIFVIDVDDAVAGVATRTNLTNRPATVGRRSGLVAGRTADPVHQPRR